MILLRLISLPTGLRCSHLSLDCFSYSTSLVGRFFTRFPFLNTQLPRSTELASKREGNCNVMVTRLTNHMISTRDHSYNLVTWSRHVTYELHPDIKASSIPTSASPFILTSSHHRFPTSALWLRPSLLHHQSTRPHPIVDFEQVLGVLTSRSQWWWRERGFSSIAINKSHWWEPRWVVSSTASWTQLKPKPWGRQHQLQPSTILLNE